MTDQAGASGLTGRRLGAYQVEARLGAGGMGEVYRARDTRLGRDVAIKVLPSAFTADPEWLARFEREARLLAALNHPHIGAIYGLEEADGVRGLILELVEGPTLAERIARGRVPLEEALQVAIQIAEALEAAHERGIIHRDLKPDNIKITSDGRVKVLDFGLAKLREAEHSEDRSSPPTMMATTPGMILGTMPYMSPEQANGWDSDRTADVWAFGCVLYEMLSGRRAFDGRTAGEILAAIFKGDPDWQRLPAATPVGIRRLLRRSLQKDQRLRFRDIRDARLEIEDVQSGTEPIERAAPSRSGRGERLAWASVLAVVASVAALMGVRALRPAPTAPETRFEINTPATRNASLAISPDGLKVIFVSGTGERSQLWLRELGSLSAQPLAGGERGATPFWSPDGRSIGFFADSKLKRIDLDAGSVRTLTSGHLVSLGGSWNRDGTIVFANSPGGPIFRVSAEGGEPAAATRLELPQQRGHLFPRFLPDGRHFIFFVTGSAEARGVYVGQLDRLDSRRLFDADAPAEYASTNHLVFVRQGKLWAHAFDPDRLELHGDPYPIAENVTADTTVSASATGTIAHRTAAADSQKRQLVWVERSGREIEKEVYADNSAMGPALSHDGRRVAVYRFANGNMDIWSYETRRRAWDRLTVDPGDDIWPLWSRDDASMVFGAVRNGHTQVDLFRTFLHAPEKSDELLLSTSQPKFPMDWSTDGRFVLYASVDPKRGFDLWALPMDGKRTPFAVVQTDFNEGSGQFSPDSRWVAYESDKTGRTEIFVRPFPGPGGDVRVSTDGGSQPRWNPNGKELFYIAADDRLMAIPIQVSSNGTTTIIEPGTPTGLFPTNVGSTALNAFRAQYAVHANGQSFVMNSAVGESSASPITIILNWKPRR